MSEPMIQMQQVYKTFGGTHPILDHVDLKIPAGEKLVVIGPSGSGKSTLLRILMTLEDIQSGQVLIEGQPLWEMQQGQCVKASGETLKKIRGKVGMVFQQFNLFPHMNVIENVMEAPMQVLKKSKSEAEQLAKDYLTRVGLADKLDAKPARLSGGQKQRVAIARALAMHPQVMLFDEVTALDPELAADVLGVIRDLAHAHDMTLILVTHQMEFAKEIADRVLFMDQGHIVEQGSPDQIFTDPKQPRTQSFLKAVLSNR